MTIPAKSLEQRRAASRERQRRYRERVSSGMWVGQIAGNDDILDALIQRGFIAEEDSFDREKRDDALNAAMRDWARPRTTVD